MIARMLLSAWFALLLWVAALVMYTVGPLIALGVFR